MRARIGASGSLAESFGIADLRADCLGYVLARRVRNHGGRPFHYLVGELLKNINDDPGWLAKEFLNTRFGSRQNAVAAAEAALQNNPFNDTVLQNLYSGFRRPGHTYDDGRPNPSQSVRGTELNACARAFTDVLVDAQSSWTLRS